MARESLAARAEQAAAQLLVFDRLLTPEEIAASIDAVTPEAIGRLGGRLLDAETERAGGARTRASAGRGRPFSPGVVRLRDLAKLASYGRKRPPPWLCWTGYRPTTTCGSRASACGFGPTASSDFEEWAALRSRSRAFLQPWEPTWPADDLTRAAWRRRLSAYAHDIERGLAYPFLVFRESDNAMVGGITLSNIRRGVAQMGADRLLGRPAVHPAGLHGGGGARR